MAHKHPNRCQLCKYFAPIQPDQKRDGYSRDADPDGAHGVCHRHAPIAVPTFLIPRDDDMYWGSWPNNHSASWPTVSRDDWCGDFEKSDGAQWHQPDSYCYLQHEPREDYEYYPEEDSTQ